MMEDTIIIFFAIIIMPAAGTHIPAFVMFISLSSMDKRDFSIIVASKSCKNLFLSLSSMDAIYRRAVSMTH
jgi:hypothetical protein